MQFFFQKPFILEVKKLLKNNSYQDCELAIIENIFKKSFEEIKAVCSATRLNPSSENPIAKLRIGFDKGKSSSYRLYVLVLFKKNKLYFAFIHPKKGVFGKDALNKKEEIEMIKVLLNNVKQDDVFEVFWNIEKNKICYLADEKAVF